MKHFDVIGYHDADGGSYCTDHAPDDTSRPVFAGDECADGHHCDECVALEVAEREQARKPSPDLFARRFAAANGGARDLYDVQRHVQLRRQHAAPGTVAWFFGTLATKYTSVGCYPKFWLASDGETLSYEACLANAGRIARAIRDGSNDGWRVVACDVNWEDPDMRCADTDERIESASAEDDAV